MSKKAKKAASKAKPSKKPDGQQAGHEAAAAAKEKPVVNNLAVNGEGHIVPEATEIDALRQEVAELTGALDRKNRHELAILKADKALGSVEAEMAECKETLKEIKERHEKAVTVLRNEIQRRDGQNELPFKEEPKAAVVEQKADKIPTPLKGGTPDAGAAMPLGSLKKHGITEKKLEQVIEAVGGTIGHLEKAMRENEWWHRDIKGFGETWVTKLVDALVAFRAVYPVPVPDPSEEPIEVPPPAEDAPQDTVSQLKPDETLAIPVTGAEVSMTIRWVSTASRYQPVVTAEVPEGLRIAGHTDQPPVLFPQREQALLRGCELLATWFEQRVPNIGEKAGSQIRAFAAEKMQENAAETNAANERANAGLERIETLLSRLEDELEPDNAKDIALRDQAVKEAEALHDAVCNTGRIDDAEEAALAKLEKRVERWMGQEVPF